MIHIQILKLLYCGRKYRGSQNYVYACVLFQPKMVTWLSFLFDYYLQKGFPNFSSCQAKWNSTFWVIPVKNFVEKHAEHLWKNGPFFLKGLVLIAVLRPLYISQPNSASLMRMDICHGKSCIREGNTTGLRGYISWVMLGTTIFLNNHKEETNCQGGVGKISFQVNCIIAALLSSYSMHFLSSDDCDQPMATDAHEPESLIDFIISQGGSMVKCFEHKRCVEGYLREYQMKLQFLQGKILSLREELKEAKKEESNVTNNTRKNESIIKSTIDWNKARMQSLIEKRNKTRQQISFNDHRLELLDKLKQDIEQWELSQWKVTTLKLILFYKI